VKRIQEKVPPKTGFEFRDSTSRTPVKYKNA